MSVSRSPNSLRSLIATCFYRNGKMLFGVTTIQIAVYQLIKYYMYARWLEPRPSNPAVVGSSPGGADIHVPAVLRSR